MKLPFLVLALLGRCAVCRASVWLTGFTVVVKVGPSRKAPCDYVARETCGTHYCRAKAVAELAEYTS